MKMTLKEIREEYEKNYNEICKVIEQMGGDGFIALHRKHNTELYRKLRELQKKEHYLDALENQIRNYLYKIPSKEKVNLEKWY